MFQTHILSKPDLHLKMLFQELRLWCRAIQNANLLQKVHTVRNQSSKTRLIWIWPPASLHNLKETPALPKRKGLLLRKTMTPLVCFTNPILQLHPSITNIRHSLWGLGRILVVRSCISGSAGTLSGGHGKQKGTPFLKTSLTQNLAAIHRDLVWCLVSLVVKKPVSGSLMTFRDIQSQWLCWMLNLSISDSASFSPGSFDFSTATGTFRQNAAPGSI